jgi:hypothetical protein
MKRYLMTLFLLGAMYPALPQVHVRLNVGYNLPMNSDLIALEFRATENSQKVEAVYGSYGSGFSGHVAFGGFFKNGALGSDLELGYLAGKKITSASTYDAGGYEQETKTAHNSQSFQFVPSLTFSAGTGSIQPFARMGPVIALTTLYQKTNSANNQDESYSLDYKYSGNIAVGLKGVVGAAYSLNDNLQLYIEMDFISMAYSPKKRTITKYTENGQDQIDQIDSEDIEVDLEEEETLEEEEGVPPMKQPHSMGSLGLQFGVKFTF